MRGQRKYNAERFQVGCYVDESAGSADECNRRTVEFARYYGFRPGRGWACDSESLSWSGDGAVEHLNSLESRPYMYWGFEDNSLFLMPSLETAKEDCGFCSSKDQEYPDDDYRGEWLHINERGNCVLYARGPRGKDTKIWSVV